MCAGWSGHDTDLSIRWRGIVLGLFSLLTSPEQFFGVVSLILETTGIISGDITMVTRAAANQDIRI